MLTVGIRGHSVHVLVSDDERNTETILGSLASRQPLAFDFWTQGTQKRAVDSVQGLLELEPKRYMFPLD